MKLILWMLLGSAALSVNAFADTQLFRTKIYEAQTILQTPKFGVFRDVVGQLNIARELTDNPIAQNEVVSAITVLSNKSIEDTDLIEKVNAHLESALRNDRVKLKDDRTLAGESLKALLMATMFGDASEKIQIRSDKYSKPQLLSLLVTYLADTRAAKFDPDVRDLVENKEVSFVLPPERVLLDENVDKNAFVSDLKDQIKSMTPDEKLPISFKVSTSKTGEVLISVEMKGIDAVGFVETWVRNPLVLANGNRYLSGFANKLEAASTTIKSQYLGHNTTFQKIATSFATQLLDPAEDLIRNKLVSERWSTPSVEIVKAQLQQRTAITIEHMNKNLNRNLEKLKSALGTEKEVADLKAKTAAWINEAEQKLKVALGDIDKAVDELMKTEAYAKASSDQKSAMRVTTAEQAGNTKLFSWQKILGYVSAALSAYYVYEWSAQTYRNTDPKAQQTINEKYGVKLVNTMLYLVPVAGELAIVVDLFGHMVLNFAFNAVQFQYRIPSVETLLHMGIDGFVNVALAMRGIHEFDVVKNDMLAALKISRFKDGKGVWWDGDMVKKANELQFVGFTPLAKEIELNKTVKGSAYKYLSLYYTLNSRFPNEQESLWQFYEDILSQWKTKNSNFITSGMSLL